MSHLHHNRYILDVDREDYTGMINVDEMLAELRQQRQLLEQAIVSFERLAGGASPRRGRPPKWMADIPTPKRRGRPPGRKNRPNVVSAGGSAPLSVSAVA